MGQDQGRKAPGTLSLAGTARDPVAFADGRPTGTPTGGASPSHLAGIMNTAFIGNLGAGQQRKPCLRQKRGS